MMKITGFSLFLFFLSKKTHFFVRPQKLIQRSKKQCGGIRIGREPISVVAGCVKIWFLHVTHLLEQQWARVSLHLGGSTYLPPSPHVTTICSLSSKETLGVPSFESLVWRWISTYDLPLSEQYPSNWPLNWSNRQEPKLFLPKSSLFDYLSFHSRPFFFISSPGFSPDALVSASTPKHAPTSFYPFLK